MTFMNQFNQEKPLSREEIRKIRPSVRNMYMLQKEQLTRTERLATSLNEKLGTMGFFYILLIWTILWVAWNLYAPMSLRFDAVPAFALWIFISEAIQLLLMPLLMMGQNLQGAHSDRRAQADFELNLIAEKEIDTILIHLENQNEKILKILEHLERIESQKK